MVKNPPPNAGETRDRGSIARLGRSPGEGNGNLLQSSCLENSMDSDAWWATVHGVGKNQTQTEHTQVCARARTHTHTHTHTSSEKKIVEADKCHYTISH